MRIITAFEQVAVFHEAGPWHPEIGIEEYPNLSRKEQKALYNEIKSQNGSPLLSNTYHPDNWGSGDPAGRHHYVARGQDGTIHGVLAATRSYNKMEPKRRSRYNNLDVHDVYTGDDAPKGTGTALMQAAAHRAMRDGADFKVWGAVPHARGFYHSMGGTSSPNSKFFSWTNEDRDALAKGTPNKKPVTPMSGTWRANPTYIPDGTFEQNNTLQDAAYPPKPGEGMGYGDMYVPEESRKRGEQSGISP
jgi:hypothetical protein